MSYRRKKDKLFIWRAKNRTALNGLGIPECVASDHRRFLHVMDECFDWETRWNARQLSDGQAVQLLRLLEEVAGPEYRLVHLLRHRTGVQAQEREEQ